MCVVFSNVLCCLDFGVWIIELKFSLFLYFFPHLSLFSLFSFLFFPLLHLSLEPLVLLMPRHLIVPCAASSYYLVASSYCFNSLPHHVALLPSGVASSHYFATSSCCLITLPCCVALVPFATWLPLHLRYLLTLPPPFVVFDASHLTTSSHCYFTTLLDGISLLPPFPFLQGGAWSLEKQPPKKG